MRVGLRKPSELNRYEGDYILSHVWNSLLATPSEDTFPDEYH